MSVQSADKAAEVSLCSAGMLASSRSSQNAGEVGGGGAVGLVLAERLRDQAAGVLDLPVGELVRAVSSSPR